MAKEKFARAKDYQPRADDGPKAKAVLNAIELCKLSGWAAQEALRTARYEDWKDAQANTAEAG